MNSFVCIGQFGTQLLLDVMYLDDVFVGEGFMWLVVLCVLQEDLVHVSTGVLVQFVAAAEDDQRYLTITQNGQFIGFLHDTKLPLVESHLKRRPF